MKPKLQKTEYTPRLKEAIHDHIDRTREPVCTTFFIRTTDQHRQFLATQVPIISVQFYR